jgi:hypothetical protein
MFEIGQKVYYKFAGRFKTSTIAAVTKLEACQTRPEPFTGFTLLTRENGDQENAYFCYFEPDPDKIVGEWDSNQQEPI